MPGRTIRIRSRDGGEFDCYLSLPDTAKPVAAVVLASAVHGVDADVRAIADTFASHGYHRGGARSVLAFDPGAAAARGQARRRTLAAAA